MNLNKNIQIPIRKETFVNLKKQKFYAILPFKKERKNCNLFNEITLKKSDDN